MSGKIIKQEYRTPQVEVLVTRVERGFAVSGSSEPEHNNGTEGLSERSGSPTMFS